MSYAAPNRVNDFVIKIATVNGTGSASANGLLMKAVFRSGVPVVQAMMVVALLWCVGAITMKAKILTS